MGVCGSDDELAFEEWTEGSPEVLFTDLEEGHKFGDGFSRGESEVSEESLLGGTDVIFFEELGLAGVYVLGGGLQEADAESEFIFAQEEGAWWNHGIHIDPFARFAQVSQDL